MKPLTVIYWSRAVLGVVIGVLCALYVYFSVTSELGSFSTLLTGLSFALLFYIVVYYVVKFKYFARVEKQSKLMTQGIGIYFFAWIVSWTLIVTLLMSSVSISVHVDGGLTGEQNLWVAAWGNDGTVKRNVTITSGTARMALMQPGTYMFQLGGDLAGYKVVNQNRNLTLGWLEAASVSFNVSQASE